MAEDYAQENTSSQGHQFSGTVHLDAHFAMAQPEYETLLKSVGLQPGWHVLDAGCGTGGFLPLMSELVGENGRITAVDIAPENIEIVQSKISPSLICPVETKVANITNLPFVDDYFDALWCANVCQYLTDEELEAALIECRRVVRPGGLIAIKEFDTTIWFFWPPGARLMWQANEAFWQTGNTYYRQTMRSNELTSWLKRAGLKNIKIQSMVIDRLAPLKPHEHSFIEGILKFLSQTAAILELPEEDQILWQQIGDIGAKEHILNDPNFLYREGALLFIGQVPSD